MNTEKVFTFHDEQNELELKAALIAEFPVEFPDGSIVRGPCWFWFVSNMGHDSWFAFAVSDTADDPDSTMSKSNMDELRRMAVWIGRPWSEIEGGCVHCAAVEMRAARNEMPLEIFDDLMATESLDKLRELRTDGQWKAMQDSIYARTGQTISLN